MASRFFRRAFPLFRRKARKYSISPTQLVFGWFLFFILLGTILLWMPVTHVSPKVEVGFIAAMFTAVSAACVTGLTVVNVAETFSFFGQLVIFLLMEMGGMGLMAFATLGFRIFGRRLSMTHQVAAADALYQNDAASEFKNTFMQIMKVTLLVQTIGAIGMAVALVPRHWDSGEGLFMLWSAAFHSSSAFCNSGFTLYPDSLDSLRTNIPFLLILLALITLGGLGHVVLNELYRLPGYFRRKARKPHWISLHTRVVLIVTAIILVAGVFLMWVLGTGEGSTLWHAVFETISGRTAGFSIVAQDKLPLPSILLMLLLMFIGGSPGSCAGGIKTTSLAIWLARIGSNLRNDTNVNLFGYTIAPALVSRARVLMAVTVLWNLAGVFILAISHPDEPLQTLMFEQISAFGTVGLSMDFSPKLTDMGRIWIIISMFVGRLGPLSMALWMVPPSKVKINRPIARIMVG